MTTTAKKLRKEIKEICEKIPEEEIDLMVDERLKVDVEIYEDWETQAGEPKRKDVMNREKFLIDSIFKAIDIDDKFIFNINFKKCQDDNECEFAHVRIGIDDGL